jgi:hypothetical protein
MTDGDATACETIGVVVLNVSGWGLLIVSAVLVGLGVWTTR